MTSNPEEQKTQKMPVTILRDLCNLLINTGGLVSAKIELALSLQGVERERMFRAALELSKRGLWALETMDFAFARLEQQLIREHDYAREVVTDTTLQGAPQERRWKVGSTPILKSSVLRPESTPL